MSTQRFLVRSRSAVLAMSMLASVLAAPLGSAAQALADVQTPNTPLVLKAQGSFFVGGETVEQTQAQLGNLGPGGHITINQMYVRFMVPQGGDGNVPVVMVHGATLTGKSWETTPDGRMGWDEYFVRRGHPVSTSPTRWGAGGRGSIKPPSTTYARASWLRTPSPASSGSATRSPGRTSASVRDLAPPTRTLSTRWPPWTNCRSRACRTSGSGA